MESPYMARAKNEHGEKSIGGVCPDSHEIVLSELRASKQPDGKVKAGDD